MGDEPLLEEIRAIDVRPYRWAVWCSIEDGEPFANAIEHMSWSDFGDRIWFCLGTHNFYSAAPDEMLQLVRRTTSDYFAGVSEEAHAKFLASKPTPETVELRRQKADIENRLKEINGKLRSAAGGTF